MTYFFFTSKSIVKPYFKIDDFLSGRDPLTLALRVEDHMMFIQLQLEQQSKEKRKNQRGHRVIKATSAPAPSLSAKQQKTSSPSPSQGIISSKQTKTNQATSQKINQNQPKDSKKPNDELLRKYCQQQPCLVIPNQHKLTNEISQIIAGNNRSRVPLGFPQPNSSNTIPTQNQTQAPSNAPKNGHAPTSSSKLFNMTETVQKKGKRLPPHNTETQRAQTRSQNHSQKPQTAQKDEKAHIDTFTSHAPGIFSGTFSGMFEFKRFLI